MTNLTFQESPTIVIATNTFIDVPILIQVDGVPLIEVKNEIATGYELRMPIYHEDGTELAKVVGTPH